MKDKKINQETDQEKSDTEQEQNQNTGRQKRCEPCMHCGYHCKFLNDQKEE